MTPKLELLRFDTAGYSLLGMLTRPSRGAAIDRGVVICAPLGYENVIYHRQLGILARRLAEDGRPVLRFDWPGVGDSSGSDLDDHLVKAYLDSVAAAVRTLRQTTGVAEVDLVGLRIGATLALAAIAREPIVQDVVLWAPPLTGREYVREMRAFDRLAVRRDSDNPPVDLDGTEAVGFVLKRSTVEDLQAIDVRKLELTRTHCERLLLSGRDGALDPEVCDVLRSRGIDVETTALEGLREVALGWNERPVPTAAFDAVATWLRPGRALTELGSPAEPPEIELAIAGRTVNELGVVIEPGPIVGIVTLPDGGVGAKSDDCWVVFATNRYARRIGPSRMYTDWARAWAARGVPSIRLDLSGTGDAGGPDEETDRDMYAPPVLADARTALAYLRETYGARRFVMIGLCSGGYTGFHAALVEKDITGVILLNPQMLLWNADETDVTRAKVLSGRVFRLSSWRRLLQQRAALLRHVAPTAIPALRKAAKWHMSQLLRWVDVRGNGDTVADWIRRSFDRIAENRTSLLFVFSGSDSGLGYLARHLGTDFAEEFVTRGVALEIVDGATHTFNAQWSRRALEQVVTRELNGWGVPVGAPSNDDAPVVVDPALVSEQ